jgi:hypothetical protein
MPTTDYGMTIHSHITPKLISINVVLHNDLELEDGAEVQLDNELMNEIERVVKRYLK